MKSRVAVAVWRATRRDFTISGRQLHGSSRIFPQQPSFLPCYEQSRVRAGIRKHDAGSETTPRIVALPWRKILAGGVALRRERRRSDGACGQPPVAYICPSCVHICAAADLADFRRACGDCRDSACRRNFCSVPFPAARQFGCRRFVSPYQYCLDVVDRNFVFISIRAANVRSSPPVILSASAAAKKQQSVTMGHPN